MTPDALLTLKSISIDASQVALMGLVIFAAVSDIQHRRIPNRLVFTGLIASLGFQFYFHSMAGLIDWALGFVTGLGLFVPFYAMRLMGAGDVKLMGMVGSFLNAQAAAWVILYTLLAGGILALVYALMRGQLKTLLSNVGGMMFGMAVDVAVRQMPQAIAPSGKRPSAGNLPYGVAIAAGTFIHLLIPFLKLRVLHHV